MDPDTRQCHCQRMGAEVYDEQQNLRCKVWNYDAIFDRNKAFVQSIHFDVNLVVQCSPQWEAPGHLQPQK